MKREYRIVRDGYAGYEVQCRHTLLGLFSFGWHQISRGPYNCNTSSTLEDAQALIEKHKQQGEEVYRERS